MRRSDDRVFDLITREEGVAFILILGPRVERGSWGVEQDLGAWFEGEWFGKDDVACRPEPDTTFIHEGIMFQQQALEGRITVK